MFVGAHVCITHGNHIVCGKNNKFEDYSEIHGLCEEGLIFGDNVTIGRGVMIRPSSYYGKDLGKGLIVGNNSFVSLPIKHFKPVVNKTAPPIPIEELIAPMNANTKNNKNQLALPKDLKSNKLDQL